MMSFDMAPRAQRYRAVRPAAIFNAAAAIGLDSSTALDDVICACAVVSSAGYDSAAFRLNSLTAEAVAVAWAIKMGGATRICFGGLDVSRFGLSDVSCAVSDPELIVADADTTFTPAVILLRGEIEIRQRVGAWRRL